MKNLPTYAVAVASIAFSCGCISSTTVSTSGGDSVTNQGGLGTGTVAGVSIEVRDLTTGDAGVSHSTQTASGPDGSESHDLWEITLGEVLIVFERDEGQPIQLTVDGASYGTLQAGDVLLIDEDRTVKVNGVQRALVDSDDAETEELESDDTESPSETEDTVD